MKLSDIYQSRFLSAADIPPEGMTIRILSIGVEKLRALRGTGENQKIIATFENENGNGLFEQHSKQFVIGKANSKILAKEISDETDDWVGAKIRLGTAMTTFGDSITIVSVG